MFKANVIHMAIRLQSVCKNCFLCKRLFGKVPRESNLQIQVLVNQNAFGFSRIRSCTTRFQRFISFNLQLSRIIDQNVFTLEVETERQNRAYERSQMWTAQMFLLVGESVVGEALLVVTSTCMLLLHQSDVNQKLMKP